MATLIKLLAAPALMAALGLATPPMVPTSVVRASYASPYMLDASTVAYVDCGGSMGSAVYLGSGRYLTAAHVVHGNKGCTIADKPIRIERIGLTADWAIIRADTFLPFHATFSCTRLAEGQMYFATGYAEGAPWPVTTRLIGLGQRKGGIAYARGNIINGMSGGPVSDLDGVVHAINDTRSEDGIPDSGVVEVADTPLCERKTQ